MKVKIKEGISAITYKGKRYEIKDGIVEIPLSVFNDWKYRWFYEGIAKEVPEEKPKRKYKKDILKEVE